ncbi:MAG TPA: hypothetical protein VFG22_02005 [Polyangiales bacterium]|nr:hypothetical protein [Polyangiales bacterium]
MPDANNSHRSRVLLETDFSFLEREDEKTKAKEKTVHVPEFWRVGGRFHSAKYRFLQHCRRMESFANAIDKEGIPAGMVNRLDRAVTLVQEAALNSTGKHPGKKK